jgi:hypothetical protein
MMRATPGSAGGGARGNVSHRAREIAVASGAIAESEDISHGARVNPAMTAVSKPNNIPARLATMMTLMCATPPVDFRSVPRPCAWTPVGTMLFLA